MAQPPANENDKRILLSASDINRAAAEGVLSQADADRLVHWAYDQRFSGLLISEAEQSPAPEQRKGFNLVTVLYYFGAMLMISACAWFLGDKWSSLGSRGVCITVLIYISIAISLGLWIRGKGYVIAGGLLVTVAVSLVPLLVYTIEDMTALWPADPPGAYKNFYPWIHGSWIVMELATIAASAIALRFVPFGFLTAPMAFALWFFSMDVAALILRQNELDWNTRNWVSVTVGLITMVVGYGLDRTMGRRDVPKTEDFAFWCYLFGLMAFWGGLTAMDSGSELKRAIYLLINLGLVAIAVRLKRATFLLFGALGVYGYVGHLAYAVFKDSVLFPFVLAALGLSMILLTVIGQRWLRKHLETTARA